MALLFFLIVMIGLGLISWRFGADSRTGRDWQPYRLPGETVDS